MAKSIMMSAPMVLAIGEGRKTQTRRLVKPQPPEDYGTMHVGTFAPLRVDSRGEQYPGPEVFGVFTEDGDWALRARYQPGDVVYVKETWAESAGDIIYRADCPDGGGGTPSDYCVAAFEVDGRDDRWRSPLHMPALAARYWLKVEAVRVERLQAISEADAIAEGVDAWESCPPECVSKSHERDGHRMRVDPRAAYAALINSIYGPGTWESNPWVWAYTFSRTEAKQ